MNFKINLLKTQTNHPGHIEDDQSEYTHVNGYKLDIKGTSCIDNYVSTFDLVGDTYTSVSGSKYRKLTATNVWDITYLK